MAILIRPPSDGDRDAVVALIHGLRIHQGDKTTEAVSRSVWDDLTESRSLLRMLVAEVDGTLVGYSLFHEAYEPAFAAKGAFICDLFVDAAFRRRGIARMLVAATTREAAADGKQFLWWVSLSWNDEARGFYRSLGAIEHSVFAHALIQGAFRDLAASG